MLLLEEEPKKNRPLGRSMLMHKIQLINFSLYLAELCGESLICDILG